MNLADLQAIGGHIGPGGEAVPPIPPQNEVAKVECSKAPLGQSPTEPLQVNTEAKAAGKGKGSGSDLSGGSTPLPSSSLEVNTSHFC